MISVNELIKANDLVMCQYGAVSAYHLCNGSIFSIKNLADIYQIRLCFSGNLKISVSHYYESVMCDVRAIKIWS